jgi:hypothetical protein
MTRDAIPVGPAPRSRVPFEREVDRAVDVYREIVKGTHPTRRRFEELSADLGRMVRDHSTKEADVR